MSIYILDIETSGAKFEELAPSVQEYLTRYAEDEEAKDFIKTVTALYPFTGEVVAIGVKKYPDGPAKVLYRGQDDEIVEGSDTFAAVPDEKELLVRFWALAEKEITKLVTYNGRGFDIPFLTIRSGVNEVKVTKEFAGYRYSEDVHCDLMDQLNLYGVSKRRWPLDAVCRTFGIESPKDGITGEDVTGLFLEGRGLEIARYCLRDVVATHEVYRRWEEFMRAPKPQKKY